MMKINYSKRFLKQYYKQPINIQKQFQKRLKVFIVNPLDKSLRNHSLSGDFQGYKSINVTGDVRAIYKDFDGDIVIFSLIGTHSQLYK